MGIVSDMEGVCQMKIGDRVYVHGYVDEIRKEMVIIHNDGGYFGTVRNEIIVSKDFIMCKECKHWIPGYITNDDFIPPKCGKYQQMVGHSSSDYCSLAEAKESTDD